MAQKKEKEHKRFPLTVDAARYLGVSYATLWRALTGMHRPRIPDLVDRYRLYLVSRLSLPVPATLPAGTVLRASNEEECARLAGKLGQHCRRHGLNLTLTRALRLQFSTETPDKPKP